MKFMKLGSCLDTFYTEEAIRTVTSDIPSDLTININRISYRLHKNALLPKCGLLQRLISSTDDSSHITLDLHEIPGRDQGFELCAKFCYGITINLSAHNFVSAFCAAKYLNMIASVEDGNFITKLESFFSSCILGGWKDSIIALQSTEKVQEFSENLNIVRRCTETVVDMIQTPPEKVTWSYTYTRPGYEKRHHRSPPKDWWTEDLSFLGTDTFKCVISATKNSLQPQLVGEALHVYACRWLLNIESSSASSRAEQSRILETVVGLIPTEKGSVTVRFLMRLLRVARLLGATREGSELVRRASLQLEEASENDLAVATRFSDGRNRVMHDVGLVEAVVGSFLRRWTSEHDHRLICKVGETVDSYVEVVSEEDFDLEVEKLVCLIESLPGVARPRHDRLYKAIDVYLKGRPDLSKADRKWLCGVLDCKKLSLDVRAHAVKNERLPLRTVVQILFSSEQEKRSGGKGDDEQVLVPTGDLSKLRISGEELLSQARKGQHRVLEAGTSGGSKCEIREIGGLESEKESELREAGVRESSRNKGRQR